MKKMLVFQTDFTYKEGAVAAMYGVVKSVDSDIVSAAKMEQYRSGVVHLASVFRIEQE